MSPDGVLWFDVEYLIETTSRWNTLGGRQLWFDVEY